VVGTWLLHRLLGESRLDFFVNFSSGAALLGSPLLGSYAAANTFLDVLAHHRRAQGRAGLSINWGFWDEVGMVSRSQRELGRGFAPQGMQSFSPSQGIASLQQLLEENVTQSSVMPVVWRDWCSSHPRASQSPLLSNLLRTEGPLEHAEDSVARPQEPLLTRAALLGQPLEKRRDMLQEFLANQLSRVLRIPAHELDVGQSLNNLGIDSLMAVELRNHVQANLGVAIPVARLLQDPTISQLAEALLEQIDSADSTPLIPSGKPDAGPSHSDEGDSPAARESVEQTLAQLDELSDEEVEAMLGNMLHGKAHS
ncbi:MAG: KR domain-containing protein, partial [Planctomycetota bacterium]